MDSILNLTQKIVAYSDKTVSSNPRLRNVDWTRDMSGLAIANPKTDRFDIQAGDTKLIFDGTRTTTIGVNTAFTISLSPLDPSRYRFTYISGINPTLRADRAIDLTGIATTFSVNANATANITTASPGFAGVVLGDTVFVPGVTTGDSAGPFSPSNEGFWTVIAVLTTSNIQVARLAGVDFSASAETQTPTAASQLQVFSASGVQAGDAVDISAGFSFQDTFVVDLVTPKFFEIITSKAVPSEIGATPGASGMVFYTETKTFLYIEVDQQAVVRLNGNTGNQDRLEPRESGNAAMPGVLLKMGPVWSLSLVNRSTVTMSALVIHAE